MDSIIEKLRRARRPAVMAHTSEDPDALGSCFAMCAALRRMGSEPVCYLSDEPEDGLEFIGGEYIVYNGENACEHDLCVCLDCGDKLRLGERSKIFDACSSTVNIDHHYTNDSFADDNYVNARASATGEILYKLFEKSGVEITKEIARFLYIAISADTGGFKYSSTSPDTMRIAASLMETGIDHAEIARLLFDTERIEETRLKGYLMSNIHSYADGRLNVICIDEETLEKFGAKGGGSDFVNIARRVKGTEIAVCIKYKKGKMKASLRSNGRMNVAEIALRFGGGGHVMASGATIDTDDIAKAEQMLVKACCDTLDAEFNENEPNQPN